MGHERLQQPDEADVMASATANATRPPKWWRPSPSRPRTPKVSRRLAAVLPMAVMSRAAPLAMAAESHSRSSA